MTKTRAELMDVILTRKFLKKSIVEYLESNDWLEVTTSTITCLTGSCETISTVFILPYFDRRAHLSQTAQLQLEMLVKELHHKVWTMDHSFRAEPRVTNRHLSEFTLIECEAPGFKLQDIMATKQGILRHCIDNIVRDRSMLPDSLRQRVPYLESLQFPLQVYEYKEAISILRSHGFDISIGDNLGMTEELALLQYLGQVPFFIVHYPAEIKYFNMRRFDEDKWVYSVDLIAPPYGEISGGAEREDDFRRVEHNLKSSPMWTDIQQLGLDQDHFEWYLDLWKSGSPGPRGGFGLGFERLVGFFTGVDDVRQCTEFPRNRETIFP